MMPVRIIYISILALQAAGGGTSANYTLEPVSLDGGGLTGSSTNHIGNFSMAPGAAGASASYTLRGGFAGQLSDPDQLLAITFTAPASLAADGTAKVFSASADGVASFTYGYMGRGFTSYGPTPAAPSGVGLYTVTATPVGPGPSGQLDFVITGPLPLADSLTKPADHAPITIAASELLANDKRLRATGEITGDGLAITTVIPSAGNSVFLGTGDDVGWILFVPSTAASETFSYVVSDGISSATVTVTVTALGTAPPFTLQIVKYGNAVFDGSDTRSTFDFIGVPGQFYQIEYSTDLVEWRSAGTVPTGVTGSFSAHLIRAGNFAAEWNSSLFFRAKR